MFFFKKKNKKAAKKAAEEKLAAASLPTPPSKKQPNDKKWLKLSLPDDFTSAIALPNHLIPDHVKSSNVIRPSPKASFSATDSEASQKYPDNRELSTRQSEQVLSTIIQRTHKPEFISQASIPPLEAESRHSQIEPRASLSSSSRDTLLSLPRSTIIKENPKGEYKDRTDWIPSESRPQSYVPLIESQKDIHRNDRSLKQTDKTDAQSYPGAVSQSDTGVH
ncbi:hypothetical protein CLU79DRAFT_736619 [Phycomyces nitens]|nr:hypothetical protein CLU79DRAFT_736619 [Phycomyces nitens]